MRVMIIAPTPANGERMGRRVAAQEEFFRRQGDEVVVHLAETTSGSAPALGTPAAQTNRPTAGPLPIADLYIFHCAEPYLLLEELAQLERGVTVLYYHQMAAERATGVGLGESPLSRLAAYADLVVADGQAAAHALAADHGYTAMPVHVVPVDAQTTPAEYDLLWAEAVAAATAWLPNRPYPYGRLAALDEIHPPAVRTASASTESAPATDLDSTLLRADLEALLASAATMPRDYVVRSRLPVVGPLLAWLRRNLTSHLREPYIDPTFQRQELFNRQVAKTLDGLVRQQATRLAELEQRLASLERRLPADNEESRPPFSPPEA
jgi:hypothetical protein